jgi:HPt (histidine-containing phosphotransfer) domain-containing protein
MEVFMSIIPGNTGWVKELIPGLETRVDQFVVDTDEVDDELVEVFIEEIRRLSGELQEGVGQGDAAMVRMAAHSIKGMGGTMGLPEISVLGLEVENMAKEDRLADAVPLVEALAQWILTLD